MKRPTTATVRNVRAALRAAMPDEEAHDYVNHRIRVSSNSRRTGVRFSSGGWEVTKRYAHPTDLVTVRYLSPTSGWDNDFSRRRREANTARMIDALAEAGFTVYSTWRPKRAGDLRFIDTIVEAAQ